MGLLQKLFPSSSSVDALPSNPTTVDIVIYMASLASNPQEIDPILDTVRGITASTSPDNLTAKQQSSIMHVYLDLETYLITHESLRKFNRDDLRSRLPRDFVKAINSSEVRS